MLCTISISTVNNNLVTIHKTNHNINLFYPFLDQLMQFDIDGDYLHDEFTIRLTKDDLNSIKTSKLEEKEFLNELSELSIDSQFIEIEGRFRRLIRVS